ncbi:hypothetical protein DENIT_20226 [Pseudomonas veronii]|nr:hypothetical protein DENIT_20226 [Pseudomonas veronii]
MSINRRKGWRWLRLKKLVNVKYYPSFRIINFIFPEHYPMSKDKEPTRQHPQDPPRPRPEESPRPRPDSDTGKRHLEPDRPWPRR